MVVCGGPREPRSTNKGKRSMNFLKRILGKVTEEAVNPIDPRSQPDWMRKIRPGAKFVAYFDDETTKEPRKGKVIGLSKVDDAVVVTFDVAKDPKAKPELSSTLNEVPQSGSQQ